jgi:hypothetical protein
VDEQSSGLWFEKKDGGVGIAPVAWQGRFAIALYVVLVLLAVVIYSFSQVGLMILVVVIYSVIFGLVVVAKSDILKDQQPPEQ